MREPIRRKAQPPQPNVFDIAYKQKNALSASVQQTMNRLAEQKYGQRLTPSKQSESSFIRYQ